MLITPTVRQLLVAGSPQLAALSMGAGVTYPGVLLQQLSANDTDVHLDLNTASWIGSIHGLAGIPSILMPSLMQWKGRKFAFVVSCLLSIIGWVIASTANNINAILISECFHGFSSHSLHAISLLAMSEMVSPQYRNVSMILLFVVQTFGMAVTGVVGRYLHWKTVSLIMGAPVMLAIPTVFLWPESPSWLAYKGRFDECEQAFQSLRGSCEVSKRELQELIEAHRANLTRDRRKPRSSFGFLWKTLKSRDFYLPTLHILVLLNLNYWSGGLVILVYSVDIVERVTFNQDVSFSLYGGIITNGILFVCVACSAVLIKHFKNKPVLFFGTLGAVSCLLGVSLVNYLQNIDMVSKQSLIGLCLLVGFTISISLGMSIIFSTAAELMPVKHRGIGGALYVIFTCILHSSSLKLVPYLFEYIDLWGTFLVFAVNAVLSGIFVLKYVPETKARTLQQLEDYYCVRHCEDEEESMKWLRE